jgi:glycoside/pentoside/hexuronide:cation symporter, GPH family
VLTLAQRLSFGALALPLALIGLPLYVYLPSLFAQGTGLSLPLIGTVLLLSRLIEACADPLLGRWVARWHANNVSLLRTVSLLLALALAAGLLALLAAPLWLMAFTQPYAKAGALCLLVLLIYLVYSWLSIVHYTMATAMVAAGEPATRLYSVREALALLGVLLGSVLPLGLSWVSYGWVCAAMIALACGLLRPFWAVLQGVPLMTGMTDMTGRLNAATSEKAPLNNPNSPLNHAHTDASGSKLHHTAPRSDKHPDNRLDNRLDTQAPSHARLDPYTRRLLTVFFVSTLAGSLPASLLGFYVADVLGLGDRAPQYLAIYFATGALGFAAWPRLARRFAPQRVWALAMAVVAVVFIGTVLLHRDTPHVALWFGAVCAATGVLLGAEWMLPQSLLAAHLAATGRSADAGRVFGVWTWAQKTALALATGVALWGLAALGYRPNDASSNTLALVLLYGGVPALLKALSAVLAWRLLNDTKI